MTIDVETILSIYQVVLTLAVGVIGFFLTRTFKELDNKASKGDLENAKKDIDENSRSISKIKDSYLTKEDYFREQAKVDRKLDDIMKILMELSNKGGGMP